MRRGLRKAFRQWYRKQSITFKCLTSFVYVDITPIWDRHCTGSDSNTILATENKDTYCIAALWNIWFLRLHSFIKDVVGLVRLNIAAIVQTIRIGECSREVGNWWKRRGRSRDAVKWDRIHLWMGTWYFYFHTIGLNSQVNIRWF